MVVMMITWELSILRYQVISAGGREPQETQPIEYSLQWHWSDIQRILCTSLFFFSDVSFKLEGIHDEYFKVSCIFLPENNLLSKRNRETSESLMTYLNSPVRNSHNIRGFTYTMFYGIGGGRVGLPNLLQIVPMPPTGSGTRIVRTGYILGRNIWFPNVSLFASGGYLPLDTYSTYSTFPTDFLEKVMIFCIQQGFPTERLDV